MIRYRWMALTLLVPIAPSIGCTDTPEAGPSASSSSATSASTGGGGDAGGAGGAGGAATGGGGGGAPSGWPGPEDTGIPPGECANGLAPASDPDLNPNSGAQIECVHFLDVLPYISQDVSGVTFRHCRFEVSVPAPDAFINVQGADVVFERSEFVGGVETWIRASYNGNGLVVRQSDFSGMANAAEWGTSDVLIEGNYIHDFGDVTQDQHADGVQTDGATKLVIRHNTILLNDVTGGTAAIGLWADLGDLDDALVEDNLVAGGGYTVYPGVQGNGYSATNVRFLDNHFSTQLHDTCGAFGPRYPDNLPADLVWMGNVWHDGPNAGLPVE
jgi:hypothetical protein